MTQKLSSVEFHLAAVQVSVRREELLALPEQQKISRVGVLLKTIETCGLVAFQNEYPFGKAQST